MVRLASRQGYIIVWWRCLTLLVDTTE